MSIIASQYLSASEILFGYLAKNEILIMEELYSLRGVCTEWRDAIDSQCSEVQHWLETHRSIEKVLSYDTTVYDQFSYKRHQIRTTLEEKLFSYDELKIPFLSEYENDLDLSDEVLEEESTEVSNDSEVMYGVENDYFLTEFYIFMHCYLHSPTPFVKIYPNDFIKEVLQMQYRHICDVLASQKGLQQLMYFIPLCYSKHYRTQWEDHQYINVLCFINSLDKNLENQLPKENNRFIVIRLEIDDLTDKEKHLGELKSFLSKKTEGIMGDDLANVRHLDMMPFSSSLQTLIDRQVYNLV